MKDAGTLKVYLWGLVVFTALGLLALVLGNYDVSPSTAWRKDRTVEPLNMPQDPGNTWRMEPKVPYDPKPVSGSTLSPSVAYPLELKVPHNSKPQEPMVMSLSYWEQVANAMGNLADLQCWAKTVNISMVVEPSITPETSDKSSFHFTQSDKKFRFSELLNISHWNEKIAVRQNFSHLIPREYFFQHATKRLVYVGIRYALWPSACKSKKMVAKTDWFKFLSKKGFELVKVACIDFTKALSHVINEKLFRDKIFDGVGNVTVLFDIWRGIRSSSRVALNETKCSHNTLGIGSKSSKTPVPVIRYSLPNSTPLLVPSLRVQRFVDKFLSNHLLGNRYIAVMLRTEKLRKLIDSLPRGNNSCASMIVSDWKTMAKDRNITKTLFFSDIGKHGSMKWNNMRALEFSQHVQNSIKLTLNLEKVNSVLEDLTESMDSAQIAFLHQQLVARATCVVIVGGGGFQSHTLNTYLHLHKGQECYSYRGSTCDSTYIEHVYG